MNENVIASVLINSIDANNIGGSDFIFFPIPITKKQMHFCASKVIGKKLIGTLMDSSGCTFVVMTDANKDNADISFEDLSDHAETFVNSLDGGRHLQNINFFLKGKPTRKGHFSKDYIENTLDRMMKESLAN